MIHPATGFRAYADRNQEWQRSIFAQRLWFCDIQEIVLQQAIGNADSKFQVQLDGSGCKVQWMYMHNTPNKTVTTAEVVPGDSTGVDCYDHDTYDLIDLPLEHPEYYTRYNVLKICLPDPDPICDSAEDQPTTTVAGKGQQDMYVWVSDRDITGGKLVVQPGWGGTPVNTIPAGTEVCIMYTVAPECPESVDSYVAGLSSQENYLQLFYDGWNDTMKSDMQQYYPNLSSADMKEMHRTRLMGGNFGGTNIAGQLPMQVENAIINGIPFEGGPEGYGSMGGIKSFNIPHYCVDHLTYDVFRNILKDLDSAGASITPNNYLVLMSSEAQILVDDWAQCRVCETGPMDMKYGYMVKEIMTSFGDVRFTRHRSHALKSNEILIIDTSKMGLYIPPGWDWQEMEIVGGTNLCTDYEIFALMTMLLACPCHHALITINNSCLSGDCCGPDGCFEEPPVPEFCLPYVPV